MIPRRSGYSLRSKLKAVVLLLGNIRPNLHNAPFVDDLMAQHAAGVSQSVACGSQLALVKWKCGDSYFIKPAGSEMR
jgi:hypothetical protein